MKTVKESKFQNIPEVMFHSIKNETRTERVTLEQNQTGHFKINPFVAIQLLHGAIILHNDDSSKFTRSDAWDTIITLNDILLNDKGDEEFTILNRNQVLFFKELLTIRMLHCEKERDLRVMIGDNQKFNPDSYIGMKFLLLDIREWLISDEVSE